MVDVDRMIKKGDWSKNILLEPDDVVHIPATPLAWIGLRIRELLFPVAPVLEAYQMPASVIDANDVYDDDDDYDYNANNRRVGRSGVRRR